MVADTYRVLDVLRNGIATAMKAVFKAKKAVTRRVGGEGRVGINEQGTWSQVE